MPAIAVQPADLAAAGQNYLGQLYARAFFDTVAAAGMPAQNEKQAAQFLRVSDQLKLAEQQQAVKQADATSQFLDQADRYLGEVTGNRSGASDEFCKNAADELCRDPDVVAVIVAAEMSRQRS